MLADYDDNTARAGFMVAHSTGAGWWTEGPGTLRAQGGGTDQSGHLVVAAIQGGGRRGHRIDAEGAAGGQLVAGTLRSHPRPGSADPGAVTVAHALTAREGKGPDSDATSGFITVPVALRGRDEGSQIEVGQPGEPAFTVRGPGGGSSYPMIAHALTSEGADASEDGTGRGTPLAIVPAMGVSENQRGEVLETPYSHQLTTGGGTPGQGYGAVRQESAVRRLTPLECERLQGFPDRWTLHQADGSEQSDSARYRQLGNSVAVPCVAWITRRIAAVEAASEARGAA